MQLKDLKPANQFAQRFGVKMAAYGPPGSGKTPIINTAPRPIILFCEQGTLSMRTSNVPAYGGFTVPAIDEFFRWFFESKEARNFDTVCVDSLTQMCQIKLAESKKKHSHGLKAYGDMADWAYPICSKLYYMEQMHTYLIGQEGEHTTNGTVQKRMSFPGQDLNKSIPHLYDLVARIAKVTIPDINGLTLAIQTQENYNGFARDRSGRLNEYEPPNLTALFNKAMS